MGYELVGKVWDEDAFAAYVRTVDLSWARGVTMHHTAAPSLDQRPQGFKIQHMHNLQSYYQKTLSWGSGPHLFIDEDEIYGLSSLSRRGVHAKSFNAEYVGIEVLGNYDIEDPKTGRGLSCWMTAASAVAAIADHIDDCKLNFHRDDPKTNKTCPGSLVEKDWFIDLIKKLPRTDDSDRRDDPPANHAEAVAAIEAIEWQLTKLKQIL